MLKHVFKRKRKQPYNLTEAIAHQMKLMSYEQRLLKIQPANGTWDWWLNREIEELQEEMSPHIKKAAV